MGFRRSPESPEPGATERRSSLCNFAAMSRPILEAVSYLYEGTSKIIDSISNANYVFLEASVGFCIRSWAAKTPLFVVGIGHYSRAVTSRLSPSTPPADRRPTRRITPLQ